MTLFEIQPALPWPGQVKPAIHQHTPPLLEKAP
jgi:hypothetical protein